MAVSATKPPMVEVERDAANPAIALVTLSKEPVNSMNFGLWEGLYNAVDPLNKDKTVRAIIFKSGLKKNVFTAGLDIKELYAPMTNEEKLKKFWRMLSKTLVAVYSSPKVTVAAVAGACPAGGCCLALCCDLRVITADGAMGLNEVALGIPVPMFWIQLMTQIIGHRRTEQVLYTGVIVGPAKKLLDIGMVDKVVESRDLLVRTAVEELNKNWIRHPESGFMATKYALRKQLVDAWVAGVEVEAQHVWDCISSEKTVEDLTRVLQSLAAKGPKAKM